jgi:hypothetical protein
VKRARDFAALLLALASLVGALAEFSRSRKDAADTYENTALAVGGTAEDVEALRVRLDAIEARCGAKP